MEQQTNEKPRITRKVLWITLGALLLIAAIPFLINDYVVSSAKPYVVSFDQAKTQGADCILVLGAGVWGDGQPSLVLKDRLAQGVALYASGASTRLLMSGDHGRENYDEVNVMKGIAIDNGVPSSHVFMDHAGFSTYESMVRAKEVFQAKRVIIVTQEYHLYRALYIARAIGLDAVGVPADLRTYSGQKFQDIREMLARVKDFFYVLFRPDPTYLGDAIPVSGNGDTTND